MAADIWAVADLLRGDYKRHEYGQVILPFTVLRRLDAVMAPTRDAVRARDAALSMQNKEKLLERTAGLPFYNVSKQDFKTVASDATSVAKNLRDYVNGFSGNVREILSQFGFDNQVTRLAEAKLLYQVVGRFAAMKDLDKLSNHEMGYVFEHLIRKFAEDSNETAGEHFTPREVIELMVNLLIAPDADTLTGAGQVINILDPACGTGGMLTTAADHIKSINPDAEVYLFGQELNGESWAVCESEMLLRNQRGTVELGNSFSSDMFPRRKFDYMLANPPFGVEWKKVKDEVEAESDLKHGGRFGAGLPRINDGSFLFLQHMISKMDPVEDKGARLAIVFNGSPLFTGAAGSGESEIRRWILENDWLEGIVALPDQLFYNTGISTYFWILSNRKAQALVPRRQAQADQRRPDQAHYRAVHERAVRGNGRGASGPREGEDLLHARLRVSPDHGRTAFETAVRDHRRHPRGPGIVEAPGEVGPARHLCLCCARPARHGVVDEEGSLSRPARGSQIQRRPLAEHGVIPEGDLVRGLRLRPRRRSPAG
jgi:type I restriction enzyme M protein